MVTKDLELGRNVPVKKNFVESRIKPTWNPCEAQSSLTDQKTDHCHNPHC